MTDTLIPILTGIGGVLFHCLLKLNSLLKNARAANIDFNAARDYWKRDVIGISLSFLSVGIWFLIFGEIGAKYPSLVAFRVTSFFVMGAMGSYVLQLLLNTAQKKINAVVDRKSNESDGTDQPVTKLGKG